jgi:hypothetical protein
MMRQLTGATRVADAGTVSAVAPLGGVITGLAAAMQVVTGTGMQVKVDAGYCAVVHPTSGHGVYLFGTMVQTALTVVTADGSHPRIDIVVARVNDLGTSSSDCDVEIIAGTPAASPVAPSTPAASLLLAQVLVPTSASSIISGDITDKRTWTAPPGGIIPVANAAASPAFPPTQLVYDIATGALCQGTGSAGSLSSVSFLQAGTSKIVNTSTGHQGQTPGTPTSDPWGIGYGQIGTSGGGGGKGGGGGAAPTTDGTAATEIKVTFTADGVSDYELAYQWGAAVPADAYTGGSSSVSAGQVQFRLYLDGTQVDEVVKFTSASPLKASDAGTASWFSAASLGTTPSAGKHTATLSVETSGTNESTASGVFVGDFHDSSGTIFSTPSGWRSALIAEQCSVRAQAVQPG